jgi:CRISPR-associated protein Csb1
MKTELVDGLRAAPRLLLEAGLRPIQGERFQPTGFADLGAAQFTTPNGTRMLLVESAQSVANRLERAVLADNGLDLRDELKGIPYVLVELSGQPESIHTSSLVEAHRLNSPFICGNEEFRKQFLERSQYRKGQPISWPAAARAVFYHDPCTLLHGVFFANIEDGRLRFPRLLTGFIEADGVMEVASGGVKNNHFDPKGEIQLAEPPDKSDKSVYSNVPYSRLEYTAKRIRAYFNLDLAQLRGYQLPPAAQELLIALSLLKIRLFLEQGLRLRTACDLHVQEELHATAPTGASIPDSQSLLQRLPELIRAVRAEQDLVASEPLRLKTRTVLKTKKTSGSTASDAAEPGEDE